jgi:hypothetical protein
MRIFSIRYHACRVTSRPVRLELRDGDGRQDTDDRDDDHELDQRETLLSSFSAKYFHYPSPFLFYGFLLFSSTDSRFPLTPPFPFSRLKPFIIELTFSVWHYRTAINMP